MRIPVALAEFCRDHPARAKWLASLPALIADVSERWSLDVGEPIDDAMVSWVAPATRADGARVMLKVGMLDVEGEHEIAGLRFWDGEPTVRLLNADEELNAMLLERCEPGDRLFSVPEPEQDVVIAGLLHRMWRAPVAPFRPLSSMLAVWRMETLDARARWPDAGLVSAGLELWSSLPISASTEVMLHTDLHGGNVLRAQRAPWLVIDPKPFFGDPAYDATQHLLNCKRFRTDPLSLIDRFAGLLDIDPERVRLWMFARIAAEVHAPWTDDMELARALAP